MEDVGEDLPLEERIGEFTFLLHRLLDAEQEMMKDEGRLVDIGMMVESSGRFIVSTFDENDDPEHSRKKERCQEWKRRMTGRKTFTHSASTLMQFSET